MSASSVTGTGNGDAGKRTIKELAVLDNGPQILYSGILSGVFTVGLSPPTAFMSYIFPVPLAGGRNSYVVIASGQNGNVKVINKYQDMNNDFTGFLLSCDAEGEVQFIVAKVGIRPKG